MVKFWLKNILPPHKHILKPNNSNKIVMGPGIKVEREIYDVFDLILIFGCSGCEFMLKIYGWFSASWNNLSNLSQMWKAMWGTWGGYQTRL